MKLDQRGWSTEEMRYWRDRLIGVADEHPDDPFAAELLFEAAELTAELGEPMEVWAELYRQVVEHPRVGPSTRVFALMRLSAAIPRDAIGQCLAHWNELIDAVEALPLSVRRGYAGIALSARMSKARELQARLTAGTLGDEDLPERDRGKSASDLWAECINAIQADPYRDDLASFELVALKGFAISLAYEGRREEALAAYEQVRQQVESQAGRLLASPAPWSLEMTWAGWIRQFSRAAFGDSPEYVRFLEAEEQRWPFEPRFWMANSYCIAQWYLDHQQGAPFIERIEPLLADPSVRFLGEPPAASSTGGVSVPELMLRLGRAYLQPDVDRPDRGASWLVESFQRATTPASRHVRREALRDLIRLAREGTWREFDTLRLLAEQFYAENPQDLDAREFLEDLDQLETAQEGTAHTHAAENQEDKP